MADKNLETLSVGLAGPSAADHGAGSVTDTERMFAEVLAGVVQRDHVSIDSNFFDDLGANSLLMAQFCARVRKQPDLPTVSMKDVYRYRTVRSLAMALTDTGSAPVVAPPAPVAEPEPSRISTPRYLLCGALQLLFFLAYSCLVAVIAGWAYNWIALGTGLLDYYVRSVIFGGAILVVLCVLPIVVKWLLVWRWRPTEIEIWSVRYVRFWVVKTLIQRNFVVLMFVGTPLYSMYLRALGAKIGRDVMILSRQAPVCTDLVTIGDGTVIRKDAFISGYHAHAGVIRTGPVSIGRNAFVGEMTVVDIDSSMGDDSQLGHTSSLHPGQHVPAGEHWHGSPAVPTSADYQTVTPAPSSGVRKFVYVAQQVVTALAVYMPLAIGGLDLLLAQAPQLNTLLGAPPRAFAMWQFYLHALLTSALLFFGLLIVGLLLELTLPRLMNVPLQPGRVYRLYGFHFSLLRGIRFMTNLKTFKTLLGDSSAIVGYLRSIGYRMDNVKQTGSNFGTQMKHETSFQSTVGSGTMVADGLSMINAEYSATSFRVAETAIGAENFLGNHIAYPAGGRTGDNCLLATKVMVPIDGPVREGVGLLGSPSFEIPRSVDRDTNLNNGKSRVELRHGLKAKNRHNAVTATGLLLVRWLYFFGIMLAGWATDAYYDRLGVWAIALLSVALLLFSTVYFVLVERLVTIFLPLRPLYCSIYDRKFWRHERFWKARRDDVTPDRAQRHAVQDHRVAVARRASGQAPVRRRRRHAGEDPGDDR